MTRLQFLFVADAADGKGGWRNTKFCLVLPETDCIYPKISAIILGHFLVTFLSDGQGKIPVVKKTTFESMTYR